MTRRSSVSAFRPLVRVALVTAMLGLAGCVQVDAKLAADGSGTMQVSYSAGRDINPDAEKAQLSSSHVKVLSATGGEGRRTLSLSFDDITKLSTAPALRGVIVTRQQNGAVQRVRVALGNPHASPTPPNDILCITSLTVPGAVKLANRAATVQGNRVTWRIPLSEIASHRFTKMSVRYVVAGS